MPLKAAGPGGRRKPQGTSSPEGSTFVGQDVLQTLQLQQATVEGDMAAAFGLQRLADHTEGEAGNSHCGPACR